MPKRTTLEDQCTAVAWPLRQLAAAKHSEKKWSLGTTTRVAPEQVVAAHLEERGADVSWCEGGSINVLIKAAALDALAIHNIFQDRQDAVRRYLEAQFTLLKDHRESVLAAIDTVDQNRLTKNLDEILGDAFIQEAYPRVSCAFVRQLASIVDRSLLTKIANLFFEKPYEYRAGWPDLSVLDGHRLSFVEVKTTDLLHASQLRFAKEIAAPLGLHCQVIQLHSA